LRPWPSSKNQNKPCVFWLLQAACPGDWIK
jgi:hypothetical protein